MLHQNQISSLFHTYTFTCAFDTLVHLLPENYFWNLHAFDIRYFYLSRILTGVFYFYQSYILTQYVYLLLCSNHIAEVFFF